MPSRKLEDLTPEIYEKAVKLMQICSILKINMFVTCTLRSNKEQERLYAQGRTRPGKIITNAKPGKSKHNPGPDGLSRAFDIAFRPDDDPSGATWEGPWKTIGAIARLVGLKWGGDFRGTFKDKPHLEI